MIRRKPGIQVNKSDALTRKGKAGLSTTASAGALLCPELTCV